MLHTICQVRWDSQGALLIEAHADESLVPAFDDLTHADCKDKELVSKAFAALQFKCSYVSPEEVTHGQD